MSEKRYIVQLTEEERASLTAIINAKRVARKKRRRALVASPQGLRRERPLWLARLSPTGSSTAQLPMGSPQAR